MSDNFARAAHPSSQPVAHTWGAPAPGAGSFKICKRCGAKATALAEDKNHPDSECRPEFLAQGFTESDYDPL